MLNKIILYFVMRRLGVRPSQYFRFTNQRTTDMYYFDMKSAALMKLSYLCPHPELSGVSLNWLLSEECQITTNVY